MRDDADDRGAQDSLIPMEGCVHGVWNLPRNRALWRVVRFGVYWSQLYYPGRYLQHWLDRCRCCFTIAATLSLRASLSQFTVENCLTSAVSLSVFDVCFV